MSIEYDTDERGNSKLKVRKKNSFRITVAEKKQPFIRFSFTINNFGINYSHNDTRLLRIMWNLLFGRYWDFATFRQ